MKHVIHLGIHKTASSFLQQHFFPKIHGVRYFETRGTHADFMRYILHKDDLKFSDARAKALFESGSASVGPGEIIVLSDEQFYGSPWDGCALRKRIIDRLAIIFSNADIVIVLRNQPDLLQSLYLQYIKTGGSAHWRSFLKSRRHPLVFSDAYFRFGCYVKYLTEIFGGSQVHVLFYEDMISNPVQYLNKWCEILGVDPDTWDESILNRTVNPSIVPTLAPIMRFVNKFISSEKQPDLLLPRSFHRKFVKLMLLSSRVLSRASKKHVIPDDAVDEFLADCYESNRLLAELADRDVEKLGYPRKRHVGIAE